MTKSAAQKAHPSPPPFSVVPLSGSIDELPPPNGAPYFVMTQQGPMVHKNLLFGRVLVPVQTVPSLASLPDKAKGYLWSDAPTFPFELLNIAWAFFRWAWDERKAEAEVDIVWDPAGRERRMARQGFDDNGFRLFVPPQTASAGGVKLLRREEHYGEAQLVGTIHSHCNGGAYHSGTDTHDAEGHDGLHMTIGRVSANKPEIDVMVAANKVLWDRLPLKDYTGGVAEAWNPEVTFPEWWKRFHEDPQAKEHFRGQQFASGLRPQQHHGGLQTSGRGPTPLNQRPNTSPYSNFRLNEADQMLDIIIDGKHLPEDIEQRDWLLDAELAIGWLRDAVASLEEIGIKNSVTLWYSKSTLVENRSKPNEPRIFGLWTEEELDPDTRLALAAMADDGDVELQHTASGIVVMARKEPKPRKKADRRKRGKKN